MKRATASLAFLSGRRLNLYLFQLTLSVLFLLLCQSLRLVCSLVQRSGRGESPTSGLWRETSRIVSSWVPTHQQTHEQPFQVVSSAVEMGPTVEALFSRSGNRAGRLDLTDPPRIYWNGGAATC